MFKKIALGVFFIGFSTVVVNASSVVPGQYIVVLKDDVSNVDDVSHKIGKAYGLQIEDQFEHAIKGFVTHMPPAVLEKVKKDERVDFVSEDHVVSIDGKSNGPGSEAVQTIPTGSKRIGAVAKTNKGAGVTVAVIDTGIDLSHPDLAANIVSQGKSCVVGAKDANDDNGHGTHVAGTIAALDNTIGVVGVAPLAKLIPVKVLNRSGSGTWSSVICGIDWVTANASALNIKVANMSLGGDGSNDNNCGATNNDALHKAICRSRDAHVTYVVAAGNENSNASNSVPGAYDDAVITVSALADSDGKSGGLSNATSYGADDTFATFSNFGSAVDLGAPGVNIFSTWKGGVYNTISGTSMATPHVSGGAALYLATHAGAAWTTVRDALKAAGELVGVGHTDPSGLHKEPVLLVTSF